MGYRGFLTHQSPLFIGNSPKNAMNLLQAAQPAESLNGIPLSELIDDFNAVCK
jgi:hypothetical protein